MSDQAERLLNAESKLIQYLDGCNWKDRGRHNARLRRAESTVAASGGDDKKPDSGIGPSPWSADAGPPSDPASGD